MVVAHSERGEPGCVLRPERLIEEFGGRGGARNDGHMLGEMKSVSKVREEASE